MKVHAVRKAALKQTLPYVCRTVELWGSFCTDIRRLKSPKLQTSFFFSGLKTHGAFK